MKNEEENLVNRIFNEDCRITMDRMPNDFIDMFLGSPPYDSARSYNNNIDKTWNENVWKEIINKLYRVMKPGGIVMWIVNDTIINGSKTLTTFKQALHFQDVGFLTHDIMLYKKNGCRFPETNRYYPIYEFMLCFSKGKPKTVNLIADRKNKQFGAKIARKNSIRTKDGMLVENSAWRKDKDRTIKEFGVRYNIWEFNTSGQQCSDRAILKHPATFPEDLAYDLIYSWTNPGDIVFDGFMGSGTTASMAKLLKCRYLGSEISQEYCNLAEQRIRS